MAAPLGCADPLAVGLWLGWEHTLFKEGIFFSKAAVVTFGGAYAVLPYVAQQALFHYGWLKPGQMMDGLGLAETTPGPLIMVVQFVGFMGGWEHPQGLSPLLAATAGALLTTWVTFTPCFLWIFLGGPYIERLRGVACAHLCAFCRHSGSGWRGRESRSLVRPQRSFPGPRGSSIGLP